MYYLSLFMQMMVGWWNTARWIVSFSFPSHLVLAEKLETGRAVVCRTELELDWTMSQS